MEKIICVAGPTASGKTRLAVELAKKYDGEVLSCDSMQIYRGMEIGTAAPTISEMQGVPHHMIGVADPKADFSVGKYVELAEPILQDILSRGKTCVVCGGTGLYADSLLLGRTFAPCPSTGVREKLEAEVNHTGIEPVLARLKAVDPEAGARLHPSDRRRIIRALEVYLETGETISEHNRKTKLLPPKHDAVWLGLSFENRQDLYDRIDLRVEKMLKAGLLDEIRALLSSGVPPTATAMQAIGYKEFLDVLDGRAELSQAVAQVQQSSRRYAKRQLTWFRHMDGVVWLDAGAPEVQQCACRTVQEFLSKG